MLAKPSVAETMRSDLGRPSLVKCDALGPLSTAFAQSFMTVGHDAHIYFVVFWWHIDVRVPAVFRFFT